jgi:hypothetical protein
LPVTFQCPGPARFTFNRADSRATAANPKRAANAVHSDSSQSILQICGPEKGSESTSITVLSDIFCMIAPTGAVQGSVLRALYNDWRGLERLFLGSRSRLSELPAHEAIQDVLQE